MLGKTHALAGVFLGLFFSYYFSTGFFSTLLITGLSIFASLLPDIDESSSLLGRYVPFIGSFFNHRGFFHSLLFLVCCVVISIAFFPIIYAAIFIVAFISHLLLDGLTKQGITLFPFGKLKGPFRTGGTQEILLQLLFLFGSFLLLFVSYFM